MKKLPKPLGTYFYELKDWLVAIQASEKGWALFIKNPAGEVVRLCQFYPSKSETTERMELELESLGFSKKDIKSFRSTDSIYEYLTSPIIKIFSKGSKWGWTCGDKRGVEKTKKLALDRANTCRKD